MNLVVSALKKNPIIYLLGRETKRTYSLLAEERRRRDWRRNRVAVIGKYLAGNPEPKLHVGCGPMVLPGWLNTDLEPQVDKGVVFLDISEELPLPDNSLRFIYSEHVIEHVPLEVAVGHFKDCFRKLKAGGVLRIAMPNLKFLLDYFDGRTLTDVQRRFLDDTIAKFHQSLTVSSPTILLNDFVRRWGHQFIYDEKLAIEMLEGAGFSQVELCRIKESRHSDLANLECHGTAITDDYNVLQTMVIEATK